LDGELSSVEVHTPGDLPELQHLAQVVTDRVRHVVLELEQARQQAMSTERLAAVGELAAGIAHEMRNPLTSVKLLIQTATQQLPDGSFGEQDLQVAQREIVRMESTIQGLLDFARPPVLRRVRHDVRGTAQRALNLVEGRARQQHVNVVYEAPDVPVMVDGDPEQLHQILVNLLLNGVESMPRGGLLRMTIQAGDGRHQACRIAVHDSGEGIPPPILARIFEPFVTSKETGTGLGLAISRRIAEEHGGMLVAANREEGGAQFTLELPTSTAVPGNTASADRQAGRP
jgi:signal transduction histidine kinase